MRRHDFEDSEYLKSFPDLAGTIHAFQGNDRGHHRLLEALDKTLAVGDDERSDEWMDQQKPTRLVLTPAACYPVYPLIARRGKLAGRRRDRRRVRRTASVTSRRSIRAACRCSACANTFASAARHR